MFNYFYAWKNNEKRLSMYKRSCRVLVRGSMNSCLIEFSNGQREVVSCNSVKRRLPVNIRCHPAHVKAVNGRTIFISSS